MEYHTTPPHCNNITQHNICFWRNIHLCATYKSGPSQYFLQRMMSWAPECQVCASTEVGSWFLCFSSRRVGPYIHQNTVLQCSLWNRMVSVAVLAVHVSKKHGIRGESGDREGTSANCLPWLRSACCLLVTRQGNTVGQLC